VLTTSLCSEEGSAARGRAQENWEAATARASSGRQMAARPAGGTDANAMRLLVRSAAEATGTNVRGAAEQEEQRGLPRSGHGVPHDLGNKSIGAQAGGMVEDLRGHHDFVRSGLGYEGS
jgi:hypothetical protein